MYIICESSRDCKLVVCAHLVEIVMREARLDSSSSIFIISSSNCVLLLTFSPSWGLTNCASYATLAKLTTSRRFYERYKCTFMCHLYRHILTTQKTQFYIYYYIFNLFFNLFRIILYQTTVLSNIRGIRVESMLTVLFYLDLTYSNSLQFSGKHNTKHLSFL